MPAQDILGPSTPAADSRGEPVAGGRKILFVDGPDQDPAAPLRTLAERLARRGWAVATLDAATVGILEAPSPADLGLLIEGF